MRVRVHGTSITSTQQNVKVAPSQRLAQATFVRTGPVESGLPERA